MKSWLEIWRLVNIGCIFVLYYGIKALPNALNSAATK